MPLVVLLALLSVQVFTAPQGVIIVSGPAKSVPNDLIPPHRLAIWTPGTHTGVPGGIQTTRTPCDTVACQGLTNAPDNFKDGSTDAAPLINAAIASAPPNTYAWLSAGKWRIDGQILASSTDDAVTLRGAGMTQTIIDCRASRCMTMGASIPGSWNNPASGNDITSFTPDVATGGTVLGGLGSTSSFTVGNLVLVSVEQDLTVPVLSVAGWGYENGTPIRGQLSIVTAKTANSLTVFPPMYGSSAWGGLDGRVHVSSGQLDFFGLENLTFDASNGPVMSGLFVFHTYGSWMKDVTIRGVDDEMIRIDSALRFEMRRSTLADLSVNGETGMFFYDSTGCLIEDNIITNTSPGVIIEGKSTGNVFGYNIVDFDTGVGNGIAIDTNHGPSPAFNLFEGNISPNLTSDGYYGGETELILFRNLLHGQSLDVGDTASYCLALKRLTRNAVLVGNVLGTTAATQACATANYGLPNIGNGSFTGTAQPSLGDYWTDWNPTTGVTPRGSLTQRTSNSVGQITLTSGVLPDGPYPFLRSVVNTVVYASVNATRIGSTNVYNVTTMAGTLPALDTSLIVWPGAAGFQEKDLDVEATMIKSMNHYGATGIPSGELLSVGHVLPDSLYLIGKPTWFNLLTWPPLNPVSPNLSKSAIPAGHRLLNAGANPP